MKRKDDVGPSLRVIDNDEAIIQRRSCSSQMHTLLMKNWLILLLTLVSISLILLLIVFLVYRGNDHLKEPSVYQIDDHVSIYDIEGIGKCVIVTGTNNSSIYCR